MSQRQERKNIILLVIFILKLVNTLELEEYSATHLRKLDKEKKLWTSVLRQIDIESVYDYALIVGDIEQEFLLDLLEVKLEKSVILNGNYKIHYDLDIYFRNVITIVFIPNYVLQKKEDTEMFIQELGEKLNLKRFTRVLFIQQQQIITEENKTTMKMLLKLCKFYKFLNVIVMSKDFGSTHIFYTYKAFPSFELVTNVYDESFSSEFYPNKMDNIYGAVVRSIPDQIMPRSVVYTDSKGRLSVTGYIAQFIRMYGKYINGTIKYPDDMVAGEVLFYRDFINWTQMNLLDVPCSITPMVGGPTGKLMSYMYEVLSWCLMMPVEQPLTYKHFLQNYLNLYVLLGIFIMYTIFTTLLMTSQRLMIKSKNEKFSWNLADILTNPQIILGHLGASFSLHPHPALSLRFIYVALFLSGLLYTTTFSVELNAFLTRPPVQEIKSLNDMMKNNRKILAASNEYNTLLKLSGNTFLPYLSLFHIVDTYKEFSETRGSFNSAYSYPVTSSVWYVYNTQQRLFSRPLFRRSNICFVNLDIMAFILPPNSLHKEKLDTLITRIRDMGFMNFWLRNNFYDLVNIGKMSLKDISITDPQKLISTKDFYFILLTLTKAVSFSLAVFLMENLWHYRYCMLNLRCFKPKIIENKVKL